MKRFTISIAFALACTAAALAIPGQTTAQFVSWTKNQFPASHVHSSHDEMSGGIVYSAVFHVGTPGYDVYFSGEPAGDGIVHAETLAVQGVGNMTQYDIRQHKKVAMSLLSWVYGANVAIDFAQAKLLGDYKMKNEPIHMAVYRGALYGYQLSGIAVEIMRLKDVKETLAEAKQCSLEECGD